MTSVPVTYIHDGSFEGLLSAVAVAVKSGNTGNTVQCIARNTRRHTDLFATTVKLETDQEQAEKFFSYLKKTSGAAVRLFINGYLSEEEEVGTDLFHLTNLLLKYGPKAVDMYTNRAVYRLRQTAKRVSFEAHRLLGLIRFRELKGGVYYAPYHSDAHVIGFLAAHFKERMGSSRWILHDTGRNLAVGSLENRLEMVTVEKDFASQVRHEGEVPITAMADGEQLYQELWQLFHDRIGIEGRKNTALQQSYMPKRYWKYLPEMNEKSKPA